MKQKQELVTSMSSENVVSVLKKYPQLIHIHIGALYNLRGFKSAVHVIYIVKERRKSADGEPMGDSVCMIITNSGSIVLELNKSLDEFWNFWERQGQIDFSQIDSLVDEIDHFFKHQEPKSKQLYAFRDGGDNSRIHRALRSSEKTRQLEEVFGFKILSSEF